MKLADFWGQDWFGSEIQYLFYSATETLLQNYYSQAGERILSSHLLFYRILCREIVNSRNWTFFPYIFCQHLKWSNWNSLAGFALIVYEVMSWQTDFFSTLSLLLNTFLYCQHLRNTLRSLMLATGKDIPAVGYFIAYSHIIVRRYEVIAC